MSDRNDDLGFKRVAFFVMAIVVAVVLGLAIEDGAPWFVCLIGAIIFGVAVLGFFRPDLVELGE